jgi:hypothetical protein
MKIKQDFVTNSSSTNFVISCKVKIEEIIKDTPLYDLISSVITLKIASTIKGLKPIMNNYGFNEGDKEYIEMNEIINNGGSVIYISIPDNLNNIDYFLKRYDGKILMDN